MKVLYIVQHAMYDAFNRKFLWLGNATIAMYKISIRRHYPIKKNIKEAKQY